MAVRFFFATRTQSRSKASILHWSHSLYAFLPTLRSFRSN